MGLAVETLQTQYIVKSQSRQSQQSRGNQGNRNKLGKNRIKLGKTRLRIPLRFQIFKVKSRAKPRKSGNKPGLIRKKREKWKKRIFRFTKSAW